MDGDSGDDGTSSSHVRGASALTVAVRGPLRLAGFVAGVIALISTLDPGTPSRAAGAPPASADRVNFSASQVASGAQIYATRCANCHGADLENGAAPALVGHGFLNLWANGRKTVADLEYIIKATMPLSAPRSLADAEYLNVTAYILSRNGYKSGGTPLNSSTANRLIKPAHSVATSLVRLSLPALPTAVKMATTRGPDDDELIRADDAEWLMYNRTFDGRRYSALNQITAANVKDLTAVCLFQVGEIGVFEASPIIYDGMMYVTTPYSTFALDPKNCNKIWQETYDPDNSINGLLNRGVAIYRGSLFRATPNNHLIALDAKTGELLWDVLVADTSHGYWLSAAPIAYSGLVFIATAGADFGANGLVHAFDAKTGRLVWTFHVIPTGGEKGADSWQRGSEHGGGAMWSTFTLDHDQGMLFVSIANPSPSFNGAMRPGDNLYTNSVVALDYKTGELVWYVQQIAHDVHDWDTVAAPAIYEQDGRSLMAVANKGGWVYIYDRKSHELLARTEVSRHENGDVPLSTNGVHVCPGLEGGVMWNGTAYSSQRKLLYVNSVEWCDTLRVSADRYIEGLIYFDGDATPDPVSTSSGWTRALDAATGTEVWSRRSKTPMIAALTPTAGGVVFTGDLHGNFLALDAENGETLYNFNTGGAIAGAASTYQLDGRQYIAITTGNSSPHLWQTSGSATVVVFALPIK
jgi:alcohol dehydrogenase (cytochrome c)